MSEVFFNDTDLPDGGAAHFAETVREIKKRYMHFKKKKSYKLCNENLQTAFFSLNHFQLCKPRLEGIFLQCTFLILSSDR